MVPSTGYLRYYDVTAYQDGFVLLFPGKEAKKVSEFVPSDKLFFTLKRSRDWGNCSRLIRSVHSMMPLQREKRRR